MLITIELRPIEEGSELTFTQSGFRDEKIRLGHEEGWSGALRKLQSYFASTQAAAGYVAEA